MRIRTTTLAAMTCLWAATASAQSIVVQQPVVDVFSVGTVVTVPDRGSITLGGISSARDARTWNGFGLPGSSLGLERSHSSVSASVSIHDFAAMDEALLREAAARNPPRAAPTNPRAAHASRLLQQQFEASRGLASQSPSSNVAPASSVAAARRSMNSVESPAASRASR